MIKDSDVYYNGRLITSLNSLLIRDRKLDDFTVQLLKLSYIIKHKLFEDAVAHMDNPTELKRLAALFEKLEFEQQELWEFPKDPSFHYWFNLPGCTCPKEDNRERRGMQRDRIINTHCLAHGDNW
jgi:hypothetical protein